MIATPDLIATLSANPPPVRRLAAPWLRAGLWLLLAACVLVLIGISHGLRPDLAHALAQPRFVLGLAATLITGITAALAAFLLSLPDRSRHYALLPLPSLIVWLGTIGSSCLVHWVAIGANGMRMAEAASCLATLVLTSLPLSLVLIVMLRHAARLGPGLVLWMGSLSVAAFTACALALFHTIDASVMVLMWNIGAALIVALVARLSGARLLARLAP